MLLYQSNRLEHLFESLHIVLERPLQDPLAPECIIVQNPGMGQWLAQRLAESTGIAANHAFPLPARFIWDVYAGQFGDLPSGSAFAQEVLLWRIFALLPGLCRQANAVSPALYLAGDKDGRKRYQLAAKITDLFDQYLVYRPDMLAEWEQGEDESWQATLWRQLNQNQEEHRGQLFNRFIALSRQQGLQPESLPERICLFGLHTLAPAYLAVFEELSRAIDVHLFHLSPCRHYWSDLLSEQQIARKQRAPSSGRMGNREYYATGNPLLASLGKVGKDFFSQLMDFDLQDHDLYHAANLDRSTLLTVLQDDILEMVDRSDPDMNSFPMVDGDRSIQFHVCHSVTREVQVLHDRLLDLFSRMPDLRPKEILVMAPDMERYASAVAGVFTGNREQSIPWSIADQSQDRQQPIFRAFLSLLSLLSGRCTAPEVIAFLENEPVLNRFALDEDDLLQLREWVRETGIRWGLDRRHRQEIGAHETEQHTWEFGLNRLLLGYVMGNSVEMYRSIVPFSHAGSSTVPLLGSLASLCDALQGWHHRFAAEKSSAAWSESLLQCINDFFDEGTAQEAMNSLRDILLSLADHSRVADHAEKLSFQVINSHLQQLLSRSGGGQAFLDGRVTFSNMVPMRSIPFRVICLLGMNDGDYPRMQRPLSFDLIARAPRIGDRCRRDDDRYLFLEAILSTRDCLYISWLGRGQRDNAQLPPSVVVSELRDYLKRAYASPQGSVEEQCTTEHPLQPFSGRCFIDHTPAQSYARTWMPSVKIDAEYIFLAEPLSEPESRWRVIDIADLGRFWNHPVRFFLESRTGLRFFSGEDVLPESEPFQLDALTQYHLKEEMCGLGKNGENSDALFPRLTAAGTMPYGAFGRNLFSSLREESQRMDARFAELADKPVEPVEIDLQVGPFHLTGWLSDLYAAGRVTRRAAKCKTRDLLKLWVQHLALHFVAPSHIPRESYHLAADKCVLLRTVADPEQDMRRLLDFYWQGLREPLLFFPETSYAWFCADNAKKQKAAEQCWKGSPYKRGERDDEAYRIALQGRDPFAHPFPELCDIFSSLCKYLEEQNATA